MFQLLQAASALSYLHRLSIIHGDVKGVSVPALVRSISHKPQSNILINDSGEASLADFGLSRILEKSGFTTKTTSGTWRYMALELVTAPQEEYEEVIPRVTVATDVWAFAMTVVEVCILTSFLGKLTQNGFRSSLDLSLFRTFKTTLASFWWWWQVVGPGENAVPRSVMAFGRCWKRAGMLNPVNDHQWARSVNFSLPS